MKTKLIFLGHSANIKRLIDIAKDQYDILGIIDDNYFGNTDELDGLPFIGTEKNIDSIINSYSNLSFFVVPSLRNSVNWSQINHRRLTMIEIADQYKLNLVNLIHPTAIIPDTTGLGKNIFVGPYTVFQNHVIVEDYAFIKEQVCLAHDCVIKKNVMISSQAYIGANVTVGQNSYIGIKGAVIASGIKLSIGENCLTHPGSIVMKDLLDNTICSIDGKVRGVFNSIS
jgi:NDP-sugar pyrophosphorylase family protein